MGDVAMRNLGQPANLSLLHKILSDVYEVCTYRVSVFHEICKTKENTVVRGAKAQLGLPMGTLGLGQERGGDWDPETVACRLFTTPGSTGRIPGTL